MIKPNPEAVAKTILDGFERHYRLYSEVTERAVENFKTGDWTQVQADQRARIDMYDERVREAIQTIDKLWPDIEHIDAEFWGKVKQSYIALLYEQKRPELAETYYNSVACRVLDSRYYHNDYIFWRSAVATNDLESETADYRSYYAGHYRSLRQFILTILNDYSMGMPFKRLRRDVLSIERSIMQYFADQELWLEPNAQVQFLPNLFFRNKGAYLVGRAINGTHILPVVIPLLRDEDGGLLVDALVLDIDSVNTIFSFARAYFMASMDVPSRTVEFLSSIMRRKPAAELYNSIGFQKHGKTVFYRALQHHLHNSRDEFQIAAGIKGMVMVVFTLPSYPYVFKMIRDKFDPPKKTTAEQVRGKYQLVKSHDRVGRMADTLEYSEVAFPLERISEELMVELQEKVASSIRIEDEDLVIEHLYIERRMTPLNIYLRQANQAQREHAIREYGDAIRDLAAANIFPGDMLVKNFGMTMNKRAIFYDYDEISYITDCRFRRIPPSRGNDDMMESTPYSVEENDVFPEQFDTLAFPNEEDRLIFLRYHADLMDYKWWRGVQKSIRDGVQPDVYPYEPALRFE